MAVNFDGSNDDSINYTNGIQKNPIGIIVKYYSKGNYITLDNVEFRGTDEYLYLSGPTTEEIYHNEMRKKLKNENIIRIGPPYYIESRLLEFKYFVNILLGDNASYTYKLLSYCMLNFCEYCTALTILARASQNPSRRRTKDKYYMWQFINDKYNSLNPRKLCMHMNQDPKVFELFICVLTKIAEFKNPVNRAKLTKVANNQKVMDVRTQINEFLDSEIDRDTKDKIWEIDVSNGDDNDATGAGNVSGNVTNDSSTRFTSSMFTASTPKRLKVSPAPKNNNTSMTHTYSEEFDDESEDETQYYSPPKNNADDVEQIFADNNNEAYQTFPSLSSSHVSDQNNPNVSQPPRRSRLSFLKKKTKVSPF